MSDLHLLHAPGCAAKHDLSLSCTCPRSHWSSADAASEAAEAHRDTSAAFFAASCIDTVRPRAEMSPQVEVALRETIRRAFVAGWDEAMRYK